MSKSIKANAFFKTLMSIVNIVFPLLTAPYVARILSVDGYTEYNKIVSMLTWFSPFAVFGIYTYGMRTISQIKNDREAVSKLFSQLFAFSIFASTLVTVIFLFLVLLVPSFNEYKWMYAIASCQLLFICFATDWANEAYESYGFILVKSFLCRLLYVIAVFVFVKKENDAIIYVSLSSISVIINNVFTFVYAKRHIKFSRFSLSEEFKLIKPLFVVFLLVNSSMLYTIFDRFVLTWFSDKLNLTYYNVSQTIVIAVINVTSSIVLVSIPRLSYLWANDLKEEYYSLLKKTSGTFVALNTPCCIGLACLSYEVIYYYSGIKYIAASFTFLLFSIRYYISAFDMILAKQVLLAIGNEKILTKIYYIGGACNVASKLFLIIVGHLTPELCVITTAIADLVVIILEINSIKKLEIEFSILSKMNVKYLAASLSFIPIVLAIKKLIPFEGFKYITIRTIISISACMIIYFIILLVLKDEFLLSIIRRKK
ncbi:MAG: oligosaccharide flippase family protein [Treponema sp.]|nr:oligosaccharide flippase family protein [Treponema sp.]